MLCLEVGPKGIYYHLFLALLASYLPPALILLVEVAHPHLIGVRGQAGVDAAGEEHHQFRLLGVGLQPHAVKEGAEGFKGPPEEGRVAGHDEVILSA